MRGYSYSNITKIFFDIGEKYLDAKATVMESVVDITDDITNFVVEVFSLGVNFAKKHPVIAVCFWALLIERATRAPITSVSSESHAEPMSPQACAEVAESYALTTHEVMKFDTEANCLLTVGKANEARSAAERASILSKWEGPTAWYLTLREHSRLSHAALLKGGCKIPFPPKVDKPIFGDATCSEALAAWQREHASAFSSSGSVEAQAAAGRAWENIRPGGPG